MNQQKHLLLAITGSSPAVVTETLYGINKRGDAWPDEIKIITTAYGEQKAWEGLHQAGHLQALCEMLDKPLIPFTRDDILVVPDANGQPVEDARSEEDHEALANFIMAKVRDFTVDDYTSIHASIAGGRKTMTFYLGYAMSLFGRHHDCLSHVLVTEGYESSDFYYPTRDDQWFVGFKGQKLNAKEARVTLTDIPFIRQRSLVPELLKEVQSHLNFRTLVDLVNLGEQPARLVLHLHLKEQRLDVMIKPGKSLLTSIHIANPLHWALYVLIAEDSMKDKGQRGNYPAPKNGKGNEDQLLATELLIKLNEIMGLKLNAKDGKEMLDKLLDDNRLWSEHASLYRGIQAFRNNNDGMSANNFSSYLTYLQNAMKSKLPKNLANCILPKPLFNDDESSPKVQGAGYGINLPDPKSQILIIR